MFKEGDIVRLKGKTHKGTVISIREDKANVDFNGLKFGLNYLNLKR